MMAHIIEQYKKAWEICQNLFINKFKDYSDAWKILRKTSILDQIYIKIARVRHIEETKVNKVGEPIKDEYIAIVNYSIIALILNANEININTNITINEAEKLYNKYMQAAFKLIENKNHDYGNIWKELEFSSITDIILMKVLRLKSIIKNQEKLIASEGISANYLDIINYAIFYIIRSEKL